MTNGMLLLGRLAVAILATATIVYAWEWYLHDTAGIVGGLLLSVPIMWRLLVRPVGELRREGLSWLSARPAAKDQGRSYEFDAVPVRVQQDGDGLRFRAEDVATATRLKGIPWQGRGYVDLATLEKWLGKRKEPAAGRFLAWARKKK
jgi:hypothetical protein